MALSDYEKRVLAEMEHHLRTQDPDLADKMASSIPPEEAEQPKSSMSPRRIAIGSILAAAGLGVVLIGVTVSAPWLTIALGAIGFVMMVAGVLFAISSEKTSGSDPATQMKSSSERRPRSASSRAADRRKRWENR